jgi:hypothetical protein
VEGVSRGGRESWREGDGSGSAKENNASNAFFIREQILESLRSHGEPTLRVAKAVARSLLSSFLLSDWTRR